MVGDLGFTIVGAIEAPIIYLSSVSGVAGLISIAMVG